VTPVNGARRRAFIQTATQHCATGRGERIGVNNNSQFTFFKKNMLEKQKQAAENKNGGGFIWQRKVQVVPNGRCLCVVDGVCSETTQGMLEINK